LTLFTQLIEKAFADSAVKGLVIASAKRDFITGADLASFFSDRRPHVLFEKTRWSQEILRKLETGGKPVCAAINGTALGGGLEIALACHHRVVADLPAIRLGLPEVTLGLLPGAGGTQRLPRLIGIQTALPLILEGKALTVAEAKKLGIVNEVVSADKLIDTAVAWVAAQTPPTQQPWDRKGFQMPGGALSPFAEYNLFAVGAAQLTARTSNTQPAPRHILSSVFEGCATDIDTGLKSEARHFVACALSKESQNLIRTSFFGITDAAKLKRRPKDVPPLTVTRVAVLGAGMMGRGIAQVAATVGLDVVLIDSTTELAANGRDQIAQAITKRIGKGGMTEAKVSEIVGRIAATDDYAALAGCQVVVEAVFEDRAVKADVTRRAEAALPTTAIFGTNTSTLPITGLAEASSRPDNFIGIHFFSPVDRMRLVEIIRGKKTSDACMAHTMDFVKRLGKVPIVVNDSRGFYTSRVFQAYLNEGIAMVGEGIDPALIENAARQAGMPIGPLALSDEVSFDLLSRLIAQTRKDVGSGYRSHAADEVVAIFHDKLRRVGRKAGGGFYDYSDGDKRLWKGIVEHFPRAALQPTVETLKQRLLYIQGVETARCMEEGVVEEPQDADVGALLGWSFPAYLGGPISMIDSVGVSEFVKRCDALAAACGERFAPPKLLREKERRHETFYSS
jgi:3-hydroxyacyl-CoA dehydrogenase/enoyl-CoA hydratase/3-hydroxybutyryl-CoA epimerase